MCCVCFKHVYSFTRTTRNEHAALITISIIFLNRKRLWWCSYGFLSVNYAWPISVPVDIVISIITWFLGWLCGLTQIFVIHFSDLTIYILRRNSLMPQHRCAYRQKKYQGFWHFCNKILKLYHKLKKLCNFFPVFFVVAEEKESMVIPARHVPNANTNFLIFPLSKLYCISCECH